jgi:hypothetical protein
MPDSFQFGMRALGDIWIQTDEKGAGTSNDIDSRGPVTIFKNDLLELDPNSPALDAGTCQHAPATDFSGTPRPQGATCDIGAHEQ